MTKKMEKALATIERRLNNFLANGDDKRAQEQYSEFTTMLDAMFMNDLINEKEYDDAWDEIMRIKHRTLWA